MALMDDLPNSIARLNESDIITLPCHAKRFVTLNLDSPTAFPKEPVNFILTEELSNSFAQTSVVCHEKIHDVPEMNSAEIF